jgi:hypothetical protein
MSDCVDDVAVGSQLVCGAGLPIALGVGPTKIRGSAFVEGPQIVGSATEFKVPEASLMVAPCKNADAKLLPVYALLVSTYARIKDFLKVDKLLTVELIKAKIIYTDVLMAKTKNFVIDHPSESGKKLVHACLEGPENGVYFRGRITNRKSIQFPNYWKDLIDWTTVSVSLTPVGSHQDIIVKRIDEDQVYLQSNGGIPIDCFFHIYATRKDVDRLVVEVDA